MARKSKRSNAERIAELLAKVQSIQNDTDTDVMDPAVTYVAEILGGIAASWNILNKGFSDSPILSFAGRELGHQLWIREIDSMRNHAYAMKTYHDSARPRYDTLIKVCEGKLAEGITSEHVLEYAKAEHAKTEVELQPLFDAVRTAENEYLNTRKIRTSFTENKKDKGFDLKPYFEFLLETDETEDSDDNVDNDEIKFIDED